MTRCAGHCCRAFTLPYDPKTFKQKAATGCFLPSDAQAADFFVYLGHQIEPPVPGMRTRTQALPSHWYSCSKLTASGDCGIYETRPTLCREFPYGTPCPYTDCEWEPHTRPDVRLGALTQKLPRFERLSASLKVSEE